MSSHLEKARIVSGERVGAQDIKHLLNELTKVYTVYPKWLQHIRWDILMIISILSLMQWLV